MQAACRSDDPAAGDKERAVAENKRMHDVRKKAERNAPAPKNANRLHPAGKALYTEGNRKGRQTHCAF